MKFKKQNFYVIDLATYAVCTVFFDILRADWFRYGITLFVLSEYSKKFDNAAPSRSLLFQS